MEKLQTGSVLGPYELLTQLGRGGMASVWVARERSRTNNRQRLVAVKAMLPLLAQSPEFRTMFLEEGQIVRSIEHPHVVRVFDVGEARGVLYMAMEWVEGDSLRTVINEAKQRRAIPPEMAVRIIADTAAGLHAAHELRGWDGELRGIVHCDVSPHNILVGLEGKAKLVDFGVARAFAATDVEEGDQLKVKFGYMSPEQALGKRVDRRTDIFALGIVLFELTTGERLFRGRDPSHTLQLVSFGQVPEPSLLYPGYPQRLEPIVMRALERDPERRFQTAEELREALDRYLVEERVLVSHAGVGQLVRRVLGASIEQRRGQIRKTLKVIDARWGVARPASNTDGVTSGPTSVTDPSLTLSPTQATASGMITGDLVDALPRLSKLPPAARPSGGWLWALLVLLVGSVIAAFWAVRKPATPPAAQTDESMSGSEMVAGPPNPPPEAPTRSLFSLHVEATDGSLKLEKLPEGESLDRSARSRSDPEAVKKWLKWLARNRSAASARSTSGPAASAAAPASSDSAAAPAAGPTDEAQTSEPSTVSAPARGIEPGASEPEPKKTGLVGLDAGSD